MLGVSRTSAVRPPMTKRQRRIVLGAISLLAVSYYFLSATTIVVNGSNSLPHTGYFMVSWPKWAVRGSYVAFEAPHEVAHAFGDLVFVKKVVGTAGDRIETEGAAVCVNGTCRTLLSRMEAAGYHATPSQTLRRGDVAVFGTSANSLDSRYEIIGPINVDQVRAVGWPIPIPHWKDLGTWLGTF